MKKLWDSPVPFLAYGLPYVYLGLWGHGETGKFLANFLYIIGFFYADEMGIPQKQPESPALGKRPVLPRVLRLPVRVRNGEMGWDL